MIEFVESKIAHLGPIMLPKVRHDRPQRPWWEAARLHSMRHYLGEGDRLLDVGAEMGDMSALFASWGVDVFLVEPNPKAWPWIKATFEANHLTDRVRACFVGMLGDPEHAAGMGERIRRAPRDYMFGHDIFSWLSDAWPVCADDEADPETGFFHLTEHDSVSIVDTVDQLCRKTGYVPTAITVDIEGGEIKMIEGMIETLERHRPKVWMSIHEEFIRDRYGIADGRINIDAFFTHHDYDSIFLAHDHERHVMYLPKEMGWRW